MFSAQQPIDFDDRRRDDGQALPFLRHDLAVKPPVLRRSTINTIAVCGALAIIYGTLIPFQFKWHDLLCWRLTLTPALPGDAIANIVIYVPMGLFLRLLFRRRGSRGLVECGMSLLIAGGISYATEVVQSIVPSRVPSLTDCLFNILGAGIGTTLAPAFQRSLRTFHAWLYGAMQITPCAVAVSVMTLCIGVYALAPLDVRPTPAHIAAAVHRLSASWQSGLLGGYELSATAWMGKLVAAAAYGLLTFLLVMAGREAGRSLRDSIWYGLSRACSLVLAIEAVQLFTISHVADWRDVVLGCACAATGGIAATLLLWRRPLIYQDPAALIGPAAPLVLAIFAAWCVAAGTHLGHAGPAGARSWLPIVSSFHRSWDGLLADYTAAFANYAMAGGLFVLWIRMRQRVPGLAGCVAGAMAPAVVLQVLVLVMRGRSADTSHLLLAGAAGLLMYRIDRAICGRRLTAERASGGTGKV